MKRLIDQIASDTIIREAYEWLCKRRQDYHYNDDVWHLRFHWETFRPLIQEQLRSGTYRFSPVRLIRGKKNKANLEEAPAGGRADTRLRANTRFAPTKGVSIWHVGVNLVFTRLWSAADALVLKATALVLGNFLRPYLSPQCYHLAGNGGAKGAVRAVQAQVEHASFVFRSDVKGYYEAIDHPPRIINY